MQEAEPEKLTEKQKKAIRERIALAACPRETKGRCTKETANFVICELIASAAAIACTKYVSGLGRDHVDLLGELAVKAMNDEITRLLIARN